MEHFDVIHDSPSHIYHSALQFSPSSSWLSQCYSMEFSQETNIIKGISAGWGTCSRTVLFNSYLWALACWKDIIAVGSGSFSITIHNAITGVQVAILSGHTQWVSSLDFSPDGTSLVSGSGDGTIKLWDVQTGGIVRTFQGHTYHVNSVSISADCAMIASGSDDKTIRLWNIQTGECHHTIKQEDKVKYVSFLPLNPKHLMSISCGKVWQWDIGGQQTAPIYDGSHIAFSLDGAQLVVSNKSAVEVKSSDSKETVATFHIANEDVGCCCFSPDNRVIAVATYKTIYIWNISSPDPHLLETFIGHTDLITSLAFSSPTSLVSVSKDFSVKFWQIGLPPIDPAPADPNSMPLASAPIKSITLQAKDGIAISSHSDGVVRIWDISTGLCKTSFQIPAEDFHLMDTRLIDSRLISIWYIDQKIYIWDTEKGELLRTVNIPRGGVKDLRISGDGSTVFCLYSNSIQAWSIWTGETIGDVKTQIRLFPDPLLTIDNLRVWIHDLWKSVMGWDFGAPGSSSFKLSDEFQHGSHLCFIGGIRKHRSFLPEIQDTVTKKVVFQLPGRLARCSDAQWDGQYLVAGYDSGELLILQCNYVLP